MPARAVPPSVRAFVVSHARSLDELELLMAIIQDTDRWWDAATAARETGMPVATAGHALDYFATHNLLDIRITGDVRYRFLPGTPELQQAALETAEIYRSRPLDLAKLIKAAPSVSDFADAFRIRRIDNDD